jgi:hypothetical protein
LVDFVGQVSPRTVILGHGGRASREWIAHAIRERWPKIRIVQPEDGREVTV